MLLPFDRERLRLEFLAACLTIGKHHFFLHLQELRAEPLVVLCPWLQRRDLEGDQVSEASRLRTLDKVESSLRPLGVPVYKQQVYQALVQGKLVLQESDFVLFAQQVAAQALERLLSLRVSLIGSVFLP